MQRRYYLPITSPLETIRTIIMDDMLPLNYQSLAAIKKQSLDFLEAFGGLTVAASAELDFPWATAMDVEAAAYYLLDNLKEVKASVDHIVKSIDDALDDFHEHYENLALREGKIETRILSSSRGED